jgi:2-(1,2-epoxy-1,2-dihydrophenyl)acetyl-CoA isomerase
MGSYEHLEVGTADHVTTVRLNRPAKLNALNLAMTAELTALLGEAELDDATRVVVLTGAGRGFCSGADIGDLAAAAAAEGDIRPHAVRRRAMDTAGRLSRALLEFDKPLVAAVNGPCAGAGVGVALACDLVLAAEDASFAVAFVRRGLVPDYGVTYLLPRLIGLRKARELCLLGETVDAKEAGELGLITRVVPATRLLDEAQAEAARLAGGGAGVALRLTKRLLADSFANDHVTALDREFTAQALCFATADASEGAAAFMEKREPRFSWT